MMKLPIPSASKSERVMISKKYKVRDMGETQLQNILHHAKIEVEKERKKERKRERKREREKERKREREREL